MSTRKAQYWQTGCGKAFVFDMGDSLGLIKVAGGSFFCFHHGANGERRRLDISEKYIGARKTIAGAKAFIRRVIDGRSPLVYIPYPDVWGPTVPATPDHAAAIRLTPTEQLG